jgi:hypothetical protein
MPQVTNLRQVGETHDRDLKNKYIGFIFGVIMNVIVSAILIITI